MSYNVLMYWQYQFGWSLAGFIIMVAGVLIIRFHKQIADNLAGGVTNYDKIKLAGLIISAIGFIFLTCFHTTLIQLGLHLIAPGRF